MKCNNTQCCAVPIWPSASLDSDGVCINGEETKINSKWVTKHEDIKSRNWSLYKSQWITFGDSMRWNMTLSIWVRDALAVVWFIGCLLAKCIWKLVLTANNKVPSWTSHVGAVTAVSNAYREGKGGITHGIPEENTYIYMSISFRKPIIFWHEPLEFEEKLAHR